MSEHSTGGAEGEAAADHASTLTYGRWARRGWMATTALLALALMLNALINFSGSRRAMEGLNRGQADLLGATLREMLAARGALSDSAVVARFLATNRQHGLRYVALTGEGVYAGVSAEPLAAPPTASRDSGFERMPLVAVNDGLRAFFPGPFRTANNSQSPSYMVIDFQPIAAARLMQNARRSLVLAIASALVLSLAAIIFLRTSIRYDEARFGSNSSATSPSSAKCPQCWRTRFAIRSRRSRDMRSSHSSGSRLERGRKRVSRTSSRTRSDSKRSRRIY